MSVFLNKTPTHRHSTSAKYGIESWGHDDQERCEWYEVLCWCFSAQPDGEQQIHLRILYVHYVSYSRMLQQNSKSKQICTYAIVGCSRFP